MAPILGASAHNQTRLQILGGYFTHKEQEQALRQRKQECREQLDKLQDLLLKLLQLPSDKRNPQTLQKIKLIRPSASRRASCWMNSWKRPRRSCRS